MTQDGRVVFFFDIDNCVSTYALCIVYDVRTDYLNSSTPKVTFISSHNIQVMYDSSLLRLQSATPDVRSYWYVVAIHSI